MCADRDDVEGGNVLDELRNVPFGIAMLFVLVYAHHLN